MAKVREWMSRRSGSGVLGEPGITQRPGQSSGGPGDGPITGGSSGPAGAAGQPD